MNDEAEPTPVALDPEEHDLAKALLSESREELLRADSKASLLLAALGLGISAILAAILAGDWTPFVLRQPWEALWWAGAICAGISFACFCAAVWPKVTHKSAAAGVTYFGEAARFETVADLRAGLRKTETSPEARTVTQLHVIARRADQKYALVRYGLMALAGAIVLTLTSVLADRIV